MNTKTESSSWRDIVNAYPEERELYNWASLNDYLDAIREYYHELMVDVSPDDITRHMEILAELSGFLSDYEEEFDEIGEVHVQGRGMYFSCEGQDIQFLETTHGISGDFVGLYITNLPTYQELIYKSDSDYTYQPTLCLELSDYRYYTGTGIALEPSEGAIIVPIENQDLCFTRVH